ncbi:MAG: hypothetical protein J0I06_22030 [Planctomycetes bacterium]|nr:hypothetical protein [Planctomycetota bacterium]
MPVANANLLETTLPGANRRRVWAHPEAKSHSLVVLTFDRLLAAPLAGAPRPEVVAAAEGGGDLDELLGPLAVVVDLAAVRDVKLDLLSNSLAVEYAKGGLGTGRLTVVFANPESADSCFTKLWRRLGDGHTLRPYKRDTWALARAPLVLLVGALLVTAILVLELSVFEDMASARAAARMGAPDLGGPDGAAVPPRAPLEAVLGRLNWRAVCAVGGAVCAVAQVWLYRRLTRPPVLLELVRGA